MSPTVFRDGGYRFFFFSREEERMHVHVTSGEGEAKFWLTPTIELASNCGKSNHSSKGITMNSLAHGNDTSAVEITHISMHGVWLPAHGKEHLLSYEDFPWFKDQTIRAIHNVEEPVPDHYYWPELDVDLTREIIENPERFPLPAKNE